MSGKNQKITMIALLLVVLAGLIGSEAGQKKSASAKESYEELKVFTNVMNKVKKLYVEEVDTEELIQAAIKGMMKKLDPHSALLTPDAYQEMQVDTKGKFEGLGIVIAIRNEVLTVISPIDDTPAFKAGVKEGDKIIKIDGETTKDITLMDAVKKLRGPKGTEVTITIMREEFTEPREFTITRGVIKIPSIKSKMLEDGYGYVRISQYQQRTSQDLEKALRELESNGGLKGLVLDLRRNPGGLLEQSAKVADCFLDSGLIVYTEGRTPSSNLKRVAHKKNSHSNYPMVVLVNKGTASGSEIVAGALQDNGRAVIMGTKTFGKGSVQTIFPLGEGMGLRLTTAKWYTPDGSSIHDEGITPDIIIEVPKQVRHPEEAEDEKISKKEKDGEVEEESEEIEDYQLEKALEYLKTYVRMSNFKKAEGVSP